MSTILFIHGHPFDRSMWRPQVDHFTARGWRVLAPDLRGYGAASGEVGGGKAGAGMAALPTAARKVGAGVVVPPAAPGKAAPGEVASGTAAAPGGVDMVTLPEFAADLVALLDAEGIRRAVVCGLSMGGQIAMELVHSYPERVAGLVLADTSPAQETAAGRADRRRIADEITAAGMAGYARDLLPGMLAASTIERRPDLAAYVLEMMAAAPASGAAAALRGRAERRDYGATLLTLGLPTLVVVGREDAFTPVAVAESTAKMLRNGRLVVLDGAGHLPNLEVADEFNAAMEHWLGATMVR
jgi:pimeloyl-ACP methyl ester carboxylesterase